MEIKKWAAPALLAAFLLGGALPGFASAPGSETDPIVTKSYVDAKAVFRPVKLEAGQKMIGDEGTEIILRSGEAKAIGSQANGISDLTAGTDLPAGVQLARDHLLLVPRKDGRGIAADTVIWVMVKGNYSVQ